MAARPRTLPAAIAPVLVGTAAAVEHVGELPRVGGFVAALIGSVFIQIGTNLANDYSDARRGADTADRLGPVRVTSSGLVAPQRVLVATWMAIDTTMAAPARHQMIPPGREPAAHAVPTSTGTIAAGSVLGRAPSTHGLGN